MNMKLISAWFALVLLSLAACGNGHTEVVDAGPLPESLEPLTGTEPRYLAFQIFEGGPDPAIPFDTVVIYTPKEKIAAVVHDIVTTIGVTGDVPPEPRTKHPGPQVWRRIQVLGSGCRVLVASGNQAIRDLAPKTRPRDTSSYL